jgi:hypothetical protein
LRANAALWSYLEAFGLHPRPPRTGPTYVAARVVVYAVALLVMVLIYSTKERGLLIAPAVGLVGIAATYYLLGDTTLRDRRRLMLAGGTGLVLAELTWAIGYWNVPALVGGAGLWLGLYVLSGVVEHGTSQTLDRRIAAEYGLVALIGALLILIVARPWSTL